LFMDQLSREELDVKPHPAIRRRKFP